MVKKRSFGGFLKSSRGEEDQGKAAKMRKSLGLAAFDEPRG
jgi:hypothetical protein